MIEIWYEVIQEYENDAPEAFGGYLHDARLGPLEVGSIIQLRWLDGHEAYKVKVNRIGVGTLYVSSVK